MFAYLGYVFRRLGFICQIPSALTLGPLRLHVVITLPRDQLST